jgi:hypothetical protein
MAGSFLHGVIVPSHPRSMPIHAVGLHWAVECDMLEGMSKAAVFSAHLKTLGIDTQPDDAGNLLFRVNHKTFMIFTEEEDLPYFRLALPQIWKLSNLTEHFQMLEALNQLNVQYKSVKMCIIDGGVWAIMELLLDKPEDISKVFERCIHTIEAMMTTFHPTLEQVRTKYKFDLTATS